MNHTHLSVCITLTLPIPGFVNAVLQLPSRRIVQNTFRLSQPLLYQMELKNSASRQAIDIKGRRGIHARESARAGGR
jgi:uncharacterized protein (UPF0262 family)